MARDWEVDCPGKYTKEMFKKIQKYSRVDGLSGGLKDGPF